jgi:hypothetical protein
MQTQIQGLVAEGPAAGTWLPTVVFGKPKGSGNGGGNGGGSSGGGGNGAPIKTDVGTSRRILELD